MENGNLKIKEQGRLKDYLVLFFDETPYVSRNIKINNKNYFVYTVYDLPNCIGIKEPNEVNYVGAEVIPA